MQIMMSLEFHSHGSLERRDQYANHDVTCMSQFKIESRCKSRFHSYVTGKMGANCKSLCHLNFTATGHWQDVTCISQVKMGEQYTNHDVTCISQVTGKMGLSYDVQIRGPK
jgi:hypothetical protein